MSSQPTIVEAIAQDIADAMHDYPAHQWKEQAARMALRRVLERLQAPYAAAPATTEESAG